MDVAKEVAAVLDEVLTLRGRAAGFSPDTRLLGSIPELDSMAVVSIVTTIEQRFGFEVADDELDATMFQTLGSLISFVQGKLDN